MLASRQNDPVVHTEKYQSPFAMWLSWDPSRRDAVEIVWLGSPPLPFRHQHPVQPDKS